MASNAENVSIWWRHHGHWPPKPTSIAPRHCQEPLNRFCVSRNTIEWRRLNYIAIPLTTIFCRIPPSITGHKHQQLKTPYCRHKGVRNFDKISQNLDAVWSDTSMFCFEIQITTGKQSCLDVINNLKQVLNLSHKCRGFESLGDIRIRHLNIHWNGIPNLNLNGQIFMRTFIISWRH